jgi:HSP20 family molecular chaperone IbpA
MSAEQLIHRSPESTSPAKHVERLYPALNAYTRDEGLQLEFQVPGVPRSGLDVSIEKDVLNIIGVREVNDATEHRYERSVRLPDGLELDELEAEVAHGILSVRIPRAAADQPRKIEVKQG